MLAVVVAKEALTKMVAYTNSTSKVDTVSRSIGHGCAWLALVIEHMYRRETRHSICLNAIATQLSVARYLMRFLGTFESYEAWRDQSWCYSDDDATLRAIVAVQVYSMFLYYPLEHISFIGFMYVGVSSQKDNSCDGE